jgi:putative DNA primase/helicase
MDKAQMLDAFLDVLSANGIRLTDPASIIIDGDKHRARVEGDKKTNLVYQIFPDERPAGWFDYYKGGVAQTFTLGNDNKPLTDQEIAALQQHMRKERERRQLETQLRYEARAVIVQALWKQAKPVTTHPYLTKKGIDTAAGIRQLDTIDMAQFMDDPENKTVMRNVLLIPVFRLEGGKTTLEAAQIIDHTGRKLFAKGARMRGNCHPIKGEHDDMLIVAEGYATGKAINRVTGRTVMVCMFAGNMAPVAESLRDRFPDREIVYAPDNDWANTPNAGLDGAKAASESVPGRIVSPTFPEGADKEHTDWDDWLRHYGSADEMRSLFIPEQEEQDEHEPEPEQEAANDNDEPGRLDDAPFRMLGHDGERYFYLDNEGLRVRSILAASHNKNNLTVIADSDWWQRRYPSRNGDGVVVGIKWDMATNDILRAQHKVGIYDPSRLRGRGAWFDDGRSVLHIGSRLIVDGEPVEIRNFDTRFIYEAGSSLDFTGGRDPLSAKRISDLVQLAKMLSWEMPVYSDLMVGFCVAAVICGALPWRPHIWITGPAGSGKSWAYENLMKWLIGENWALLAQSATTEAGIRQTMRRDARPVMFDEAEAEDKSARQRMQNVLELMRQASSETGAPIIKGSRDGDAVEYRIRSCFAFSSINVMANLAADVSRITVLHLRKNESKGAAEHFEKIKRLRTELMTPTFCQQFRATAMTLVPRIIESHEVMTRVAAERFGSRREGDQIGTLMVCFWALTAPESETMTVERARKCLDAYEWPRGLTPTQEDKDEWRCFNTIMSAIIRVEISTHGGGTTVMSRTVAELAEIAGGHVYDTENSRLDARAADTTLRRHGLGVYKGMLHISESHPGIRKFLEDTSWQGGWAKVLNRLEGAVQKDNFRFSGGVNGTRATAIPLRANQPPPENETAF